jgi:AraC-like DNA-binding protein
MRRCAPLLTWIVVLSLQFARPESLGVAGAEFLDEAGSPGRVNDILEQVPETTAAALVTDSAAAESAAVDVPPEAAEEPKDTVALPWMPVESVWAREGWYAADSGTALGGQDTQPRQPVIQQLPPGPSRPRLALHRLAARLKRSRVLRWLRVHAGHIASIAGMAAAALLVAGYYVRKRDSMRFLTTTRLSIADKEVQRACNFIEKNYADPRLSAESICDTLVSGTAFLQALFRRELGMSLEDFIAQVRMNRARIMLGENAELSSEELAAGVGYEDSSLFGRKFLEITGVSVEDYRDHV